MDYSTFVSPNRPPILLGQGCFREAPNLPFYNVRQVDFVEVGNVCDRYIAKGAFGHVYKKTLRHNLLELAGKSMKVSKSEDRHDYTGTEHWYRELKFLKQCDGHDHIVWMCCFLVTNKPSNVLSLELILELMTCSFREIHSTFNCNDNRTNKDTPFKKGGVIASHVVAAFLKHTASAVAFLHANNLMHRDIKPGNILIKVGRIDALVKLGDFGSIKVALLFHCI